MRFIARSFATAFPLAFALLASCSDSTTAPVKPASIALVAGDAQVGTAGQPLAVSPTFVVSDASGHAISGVKVAVAIGIGNGSLANVPATTSSNTTSVGRWTLGAHAGPNQLTITVDGLAPLIVTATAKAGAAAKIVPVSPNALSARVGEVVAPAPMARVTDAFDNPVAGAPVSVTVTGGATAQASLVSDTQGNVSVSTWTAGTTVGQSALTLTAGVATTSFIAALTPGDPAQITTVAGGGQSARAGVALAAPVVVRVADRYGNAVGGQATTISAATGGGSVASTMATSAPDGTVTAPAWTLGRTTLPQTLRVSIGSVSDDVTASVLSDFHIDIRFFGPEMTAAQKALFTNAAARISAVVVAGIPDVRLTNANLARACGIDGLPTLNETIDDLVIYASVQSIDGARGILAQSGPCLFRGAAQGYLTSAGVMEFDVDDLDQMQSQGILQDVITHEMLHVLGVGTLWSTNSLLQLAGTSAVSFVGATGRQGCVEDGGASLCGASVPVENNGVRGTADSHWRESIFQSELMTGYVNTGGMPLSSITVGSLADLGYIVNPFAADPFTIPPVGTITMSSRTVTDDTGWERPLPGPGGVIAPSGAVLLIKRP